MQNTYLPIVTASEVPDYVFCKQSWYLRRRGTPVSREARAQMSAGVIWRDQKDRLVPQAIERLARYKSAVRITRIVAGGVLTLIGIWEFYSLSHR